MWNPNAKAGISPLLMHARAAQDVLGHQDVQHVKSAKRSSWHPYAFMSDARALVPDAILTIKLGSEQ